MGIDNLQIDVAELGRRGQGLRRPENVLGFRDGTVFASSNAGYITRIDPDGKQWEIGDVPGRQPTTMALESRDALLVNNTADGCVYRLFLDGRHEVVVDRIGGEPIGSANYVFRDHRDRLWIAVATRRQPPHAATHIEPSGYIALVDGDQARIVADGLYWPNEVRLDATGEYAYVSETWAGRMLRYRIADDGGLSDKQVFGPPTLGDCAFPDGFAIDADGNVWVSILTRNGLTVIKPSGEARVVFEQPVGPALDELQSAHAAGRITREHLFACCGPDLRLLTSVGFCGSDLRTVVMGSLAMEQLVTFTSPIAGLALAHQYASTAPRQPQGPRGASSPRKLRFQDISEPVVDCDGESGR